MDTFGTHCFLASLSFIGKLNSYRKVSEVPLWSVVLRLQLLYEEEKSSTDQAISIVMLNYYQTTCFYSEPPMYNSSKSLGAELPTSESDGRISVCMFALSILEAPPP